jgi:anti-sigma B factor antagonist
MNVRQQMKRHADVFEAEASPATVGRGMIPFSCDSFLLDDQVGLIVARGELDLDTASCLKERSAELVEKGALELVVDLSESSFIDSTALGALISARRRVSGTVAVVATHPQVLRIFHMTGLDLVFPLVSSREEALECVKKPCSPEVI